MSRIGRTPSPCRERDRHPRGATVSVTGPQGTLARTLPEGITIAQDGDTLVVAGPTTSAGTGPCTGFRVAGGQHGLGVTEGFSKELEIVGVGYRATAKGPSALELALGFSHPVRSTPPRASPSRCPSPPGSCVKGIDKERSARWPPTSASSASPSRTRARASATPASGCFARLERQRSNGTDRAIDGAPHPATRPGAGQGRRHRRAPRLAVRRSNRHISAQAIDDTTGRTMVSASRAEPDLRAKLGQTGGGNVAGAERWDPSLAERARLKASPEWSSIAGDSRTTGGSPPWPMRRRGPRDGVLNARQTIRRPDHQGQPGGQGGQGRPRFSFTALMVVGDGNGHVGLGYGKAKEAGLAVQKGIEEARRTCSRCRWPAAPSCTRSSGQRAGRVLLKPAAPGTGVIAGGAARPILEMAGVRDVLPSPWARPTRSTWRTPPSQGSRTCAVPTTSLRCGASPPTRSPRRGAPGLPRAQARDRSVAIGGR